MVECEHVQTCFRSSDPLSKESNPERERVVIASCQQNIRGWYLFVGGFIRGMH